MGHYRDDPLKMTGLERRELIQAQKHPAWSEVVVHPPGTYDPARRDRRYTLPRKR